VAGRFLVIRVEGGVGARTSRRTGEGISLTTGHVRFSGQALASQVAGSIPAAPATLLTFLQRFRAAGRAPDPSICPENGTPPPVPPARRGHRPLPRRGRGGPLPSNPSRGGRRSAHFSANRRRNQPHDRSCAIFRTGPRIAGRGFDPCCPCHFLNLRDGVRTPRLFHFGSACVPAPLIEPLPTRPHTSPAT
jgi:hypothetical protein